MQAAPADATVKPKRSILGRLAIALLVVAGLTLGILLITAGGGVWWMRSRTFAARDWIGKEVVRIEDAGEPITTDDCYAFQAARTDTPDVTEYWLNAIDELNELDAKQIFEEGKLLPVVGNAPDEAIRPEATESRFNDVVAFLQKHHDVLQAVMVAAQQPGHCSIPVAFEDGINARLDHVQAMRSIARLLKLQLRVRAYQGDWEGAVESLGALVATSEALNHELVTVQYLVSLAVAGFATEQAVFLLNEHSLSDQQLSRMQTFIARLDPKGGLTIALFGERAMGYHSFHNLGSLVNDKKSSLHKLDGQLPLPVDCQTYLRWSRELIDCSRQDFPLALDRVGPFDKRIKDLMKQPIERLWHMTTLLLFPATTATFEACAKSIARKEITSVAIAAERFRVKTGAYPDNITDLTPEYLTAVPSDPFSGSSVCAQTKDREIVIYSVGTDRQDDKGGQGTKKDEPDIRVLLRADK